MSGDIKKTTVRVPASGVAASPHSHGASGEDFAIVEALRRGDEGAFARLVDLHHAALCRIARLYVSDAAIAEEVVQDTWIVVIQGVWAFEGRSSLKTWILRILANRAKSRAQREDRMISFTKLGLNDSEAPEAPSDGTHRGDAANPHAFDPSTHAAAVRHSIAPLRDPGPSPEASVLAGEAQEQMKRAISALPANLRIVLTMRDIEGFSSEETCNILGIRETNQRVLLHRARSRVREALAPYLEGE